jgi:hypothetical protein
LEKGERAAWGRGEAILSAGYQAAFRPIPITDRTAQGWINRIAPNGLTDFSPARVLVFRMTDVVDLSTAESAYLTLLDARLKPRAAAADLVRALRTKTKNSGKQSHEVEMVQADAWLAICALSKSLDADNETETSPEVWLRAISRTEEWRNLLD